MTGAEPPGTGGVDVSIQRCPITKKPLIYRTASLLETEDGTYGYPIDNEVLLLTADKAIDLAAARQVGGSVRQEKESARNFYDQFGWKPTASAKYGDTALFIDQRALSYGFTESSMRRWMEWRILSPAEGCPRSPKV
jgi:hypothetical protein